MYNVDVHLQALVSFPTSKFESELQLVLRNNLPSSCSPLPCHTSARQFVSQPHHGQGNITAWRHLEHQRGENRCAHNSSSCHTESKRGTSQNETPIHHKHAGPQAGRGDLLTVLCTLTSCRGRRSARIGACDGSAPH